MSYTTKIVAPPVGVTTTPTPTPMILFMEQDPLSFQYKRVKNLWVPIPIRTGEPDIWSVERMKLCIENSLAKEKKSQNDWDEAFQMVNENISRKYYGVRSANEEDQPGEWKAAKEL